jgi:hypothetical protein
MQTIFSAGFQGTKARILQVMSLLVFPVSLWAAWLMLTVPATGPNDDLPPAGRWAIALLAALVGVGFFVGMWVYGRCYVGKAEVDTERNRLRLTLLGFLFPSTLEIPADAIAGSTDHDGHLHTHHVSVNAPWTSVRVRGRRLPLVVDAQGDTHEPELVDRYLFGIAPPPPRGVGPGRTTRKGAGRKKR